MSVVEKRLKDAGAIQVESRKNSFGRVEWRGLLPCKRCGKPRWTGCQHGKKPAEICLSCSGHQKVKKMNGPGMKRLSGKKHHFYRRGFTVNDSGYRMVSLPKTHPFRDMADRWGKIREHRLIMAQHLGRFLEPWEVVHHKNRDRQDNRIENLELVTATPHSQITLLQVEVARLQKENERLKCHTKQRKPSPGKPASLTKTQDE